jgi:hypothetical protein
MRKRDPQAQHEHDNYWQAVTDVAEQIVDELTDADESERNDLLSRLLHESTDQHDYVIRDDLQLHTLNHSKHPCAALFNGTLLSQRFASTASFPFAAITAEAFEADVAERVKQLLEQAGD